MSRALLGLIVLFAPLTALAGGIPILDGQGTGNTAQVDSNYNMHVVQPTTPSQAGYGQITDSDADPADVYGVRHYGGLKTATASELWHYIEDGTTIDSQMVVQSTTTMTIGQATGWLTLNSGSSVATSAYAIVSSAHRFEITSNISISAWFTFQMPQTTQQNQTYEFGLFNAATAVAPTDGVYFRLNASNQFYAVSTFNSIDSLSSPLSLPTVGVTHEALIVKLGDRSQFYIDGTLVATVQESTGQQPSMTFVHMLPFTARTYTGGSAPASASQLKIGQVLISADGAIDIPWGWKCTAQHGAWGTPGTGYTQTAQWTNSTEPSAAALSNTAAGYTALGGNYNLASVAGGNSDYLLFNYVMPGGGYNLYITHIHISMCNQGAAVATTPSSFKWALGIDNTAASLATPDAFTTAGYAPRRIPLSAAQSFTVGQLAGQCAPDVDIPLEGAPIVVQAPAQGTARNVGVILREYVGTATGSETYNGIVMINGCFGR
jgi:hypothetical protein